MGIKKLKNIKHKRKIAFFVCMLILFGIFMIILAGEINNMFSTVASENFDIGKITMSVYNDTSDKYKTEYYKIDSHKLDTNDGTSKIIFSVFDVNKDISVIKARNIINISKLDKIDEGYLIVKHAKGVSYNFLVNKEEYERLVNLGGTNDGTKQ